MIKLKTLYVMSFWCNYLDSHKSHSCRFSE